jgi:hypothetical protein
MLIAQTGAAFTVSASPCFGSKSMIKQMMMDNNESIQAQTDNDMTLDEMTLDEMTSDESMQHACCQQECECPQGMLSLAMLLESTIQTAPNLASTLQSDISSQLVDVFIPDQKRPPISL